MRITQIHKSFLDKVKRISSIEGWREYEVFRTFAEISYRAFEAQITMKRDKERSDKAEAEYMAIVKRCQKPKETMQLMCELLGEVTMALQTETKDFLGPVMMELAANSSMGQFFTPPEISLLMAQVTMDKDQIEKTIAKNGYFTIDEPACGSGCTIIASALHLQQLGIDMSRVFFRLTDLDWLAYCVAFIQVNILNLQAVVFNGNTLTLEMRTSLETTSMAVALRSKGEYHLKASPLGVLSFMAEAVRERMSV